MEQHFHPDSRLHEVTAQDLKVDDLIYEYVPVELDNPGVATSIFAPAVPPVPLLVGKVKKTKQPGVDVLLTLDLPLGRVGEFRLGPYDTVLRLEGR